MLTIEHDCLRGGARHEVYMLNLRERNWKSMKINIILYFYLSVVLAFLKNLFGVAESVAFFVGKVQDVSGKEFMRAKLNPPNNPMRRIRGFQKFNFICSESICFKH